MCNNPNLDLININAYIYNLVKISQYVLKILSGYNFFAKIKGHNSGTNVRKITCNNPKLDLINMNAYIKFSGNRSNRSICSKDIERKQNSGVNCVYVKSNSCKSIARELP